MSTGTMTTADLLLRDSVQWQLEWDPEVDASGIGVAARDATITLTGYVDRYAGKLAAERAAKQVRGVRAVANEIDVRPVVGRTDTDIADDLVHALRVHDQVPKTVQVSVKHGHVTLSGRVDLLFHKKAAEDAVRYVPGVKHVANYIEVSAKAVAQDAGYRIVKALHHLADVEAKDIDVTMSGHVAVLSGKVRSWAEREAVERAAGQAPDVTSVENRLVVGDLPL